MTGRAGDGFFLLDRRLSRRKFAAAGLLLGAGCLGIARQPAPAARRPARHAACLRKAARYLWSRQSEDGGWHSLTYGLLRSGQSLTPFVLDGLLHVPSGVFEHSAGSVDGAVAFVERSMDRDGMLGRREPSLPDYPNYATALAILALSRIRLPRARQAMAAMAAGLRKQQFSEQHGWQRNDTPYGAWGMGGERRTPPHPGHVDLSMTRHVLQALAAAGAPAGDPAFERAKVFVQRCQNYDAANAKRLDGGFYFSTVVLEANKAGFDGERYRSYGTATADGVLALAAMGRSAGDERLEAARRWLSNQHQPEGAPGFSGEACRRWPRGLFHYYAAARAEAFRRLGTAGYRLFSDTLVEAQRPDGSWANTENLVKEDDPLIATSFAVRALVNEMSLWKAASPDL